MVAPNITDPHFRELYNRLTEEIDKRATTLASGSALILGEKGFGVDLNATAMKYQEQVSYIAALQSVLELGLELDRDRYGNRTRDNGDD